MKRLINVIISSTICFFISSCSDYLDIMPDNVATMEHAFSNRNVTYKFLFTCYKRLPDPADMWANPAYIASGESWHLNEASEPDDSNDGAMLAKGLQNANDPYLNYWDGSRSGKNLFVAIRDCNLFLENAHVPTDILEDERRQWIAEAKVMKAYLHFYLLQLYGPIPIIKENIPVNASSEEVKVFREPVDEVVDYIVQLCDEAIPDLLPEIYTTREYDAGRITVPIAAAIKAKALVLAASPLFNGNSDYANFKDKRDKQLISSTYDAGKWERARDAVKAAIDAAVAGGHRLYEYKAVAGNVVISDTTLCKLTLRGAITEKYNQEIIWPSPTDVGNMQYRVTPYLNKYTSNTDNMEFGSNLNTLDIFYTRNGLMPEEDSEWLNWVGNYDRRYDVVKNETAVGSGIDGVSSLQFDHRFYIGKDETTAKLHYYREPRFYAWIGFDGGIWEMNGLDQMGRTIHTKSGQIQGAQSASRHTTCAILTKKLVNSETTQDNDGYLQQTRYTYPIIRLTDLYLLYAETLNECKAAPDAEVYQWIDAVRTRSGIPTVLQAYSKATDAAKSNPTKKETMREIIKNERRIELCFESQRMFDELRWKDALNYFNRPILGWNKKGLDTETFYRVTTIWDKRVFSTRDYLWPIKLSTLQVNSNLVQNPGW